MDSSAVEISAPQPAAAAGDPAAGNSGRIEGTNAIYIAVPAQDLAIVAMSIDLGYWGAGGEACQAVIHAAANSSPRNNCVFVVSLPVKGYIVGYALVSGPPVPKSSLKDSVRHELPVEWDSVVRVAWLRVARRDFTDMPPDIVQEVSQWKPLSSPVGAACCSYVDEAARKLLPRDLKFMPGSAPPNRPSRPPRSQQYGGPPVNPQPPAMQAQPAPPYGADVSMDPEAYARWMQQLQYQYMQQAMMMQAFMQQQQQPPMQQPPMPYPQTGDQQIQQRPDGGWGF